MGAIKILPIFEKLFAKSAMKSCRDYASIFISKCEKS